MKEKDWMTREHSYDPAVDAAYLGFADPEPHGHSADISDQFGLPEVTVLLDVRKDGAISGMEVLEASQVFTQEFLATLPLPKLTADEADQLDRLP